MRKCMWSFSSFFLFCNVTAASDVLHTIYGVDRAKQKEEKCTSQTEKTERLVDIARVFIIFVPNVYHVKSSDSSTKP
jgi:hypothetical protein